MVYPLADTAQLTFLLLANLSYSADCHYSRPNSHNCLLFKEAVTAVCLCICLLSLPCCCWLVLLLSPIAAVFAVLLLAGWLVLLLSSIAAVFDVLLLAGWFFSCHPLLLCSPWRFVTLSPCCLLPRLAAHSRRHKPWIGIGHDTTRLTRCARLWFFKSCYFHIKSRFLMVKSMFILSKNCPCRPMYGL